MPSSVTVEAPSAASPWRTSTKTPNPRFLSPETWKARIARVAQAPLHKKQRADDAHDAVPGENSLCSCLNPALSI